MIVRLAGREEVTAAMRTQLIVGMHGRRYLATGYGEAGQRVGQAEFSFENPVDPLGHRVLIRVTVLGHTQGDALSFEQPDILAGGILQAPVGMMNQCPVRVMATS